MPLRDRQRSIVGFIVGVEGNNAGMPNKRMNLAPNSGLFCAQSCPPCDYTIEREMESPMPIQFFLVVTSASKMLSRSWTGNRVFNFLIASA